jgi:hypothetical protein
MVTGLIVGGIIVFLMTFSERRKEKEKKKPRRPGWGR